MLNNASDILCVDVTAVTASNMTAWSFQPPLSHHVTYALSGVTAFLKTETHRNNFGISFFAVSVFIVP
jgi:hypothetical protein